MSPCPSCHSFCSAAWDKNMQQSRKCNLQKNVFFKRKGGFRNLLVLSQCWMAWRSLRSCSIWEKCPRGHPLKHLAPRRSVLRSRSHQLRGGTTSSLRAKFQSFVRSTHTFSKAGTQNRDLALTYSRWPISAWGFPVCWRQTWAFPHLFHTTWFKNNPW